MRATAPVDCLGFSTWANGCWSRRTPGSICSTRRRAGSSPTPRSVPELTDQLLPAFRDADSGYHIHGQVTAGWYSFPTVQGFEESLALTFQVVSSRPPGGQRRFGLNLIGVAPEDQPLENLFDRIGELPWMPAARWAQDALRQIERAATRSQAYRRREIGEEAPRPALRPGPSPGATPSLPPTTDQPRPAASPPRGQTDLEGPLRSRLSQGRRPSVRHTQEDTDRLGRSGPSSCVQSSRQAGDFDSLLAILHRAATRATPLAVCYGRRDCLPS